MSRTSTPMADRVYFGFDDAAAYLRSQGLDDTTRHTIDHHYRRTKKLGEPKRAGRKVYWHRNQLDALIEAL
jgi:hypothetical protein